MSLDEPPSDLSGFPTIPLPVGMQLYRIFRPVDPNTDKPRGCWWFASVSEGADPTDHGRYDLPEPRGTCYFAESPVGAWLEVFRSVRVTEHSDVAARALCVTATPIPLELANLVAPAAAGYNIDAGIHSTMDRALTQRWAAALDDEGHDGLYGQVRHDPTLTERSVTLFDDAGAHRPTRPVPPVEGAPSPTATEAADPWSEVIFELVDVVDAIADTLGTYGYDVRAIEIPDSVPLDREI